MPRLILTLCLLLLPSAARGDEGVDYLRDIKPILAGRCLACHGALKQESGLRLDAASLIRQGGDSGPVIVPGDSAASLLVSAITGTDGWQMPPEGEPLSADQIARIIAWIDAGANAPDELVPPDPRDHWAFRPPVRPPLPHVDEDEDIATAANAIDRFVAAAQREKGIEPLPRADKRTLLRRVYLDLIGLPPTRAEQAAFLADTSDDAYQRVVDRLLASPHYGERWARHWMDVWRYSDWAGYREEVRYSQRHVWRWRDWIVESLNADRGYDRMVLEMLAADELVPDDPDALRATGFLVRNYYRYNRNRWLDDTVEHTGKAFLGLTFNCARCHDHMYDPIAQEDYYRLRAFFEPYDVRTDRLPGEADVDREGLARVYDAHAETETYLFVRGNEAEPVENEPLAPGLPAIFSPEGLAIGPIELPPVAYYPSLKPYIQREALDAATARVEQARTELATAMQAAEQAREQLAAKTPAEVLEAADQASASADRAADIELNGASAPVGASDDQAEGEPLADGVCATAREVDAVDAAVLLAFKAAAAAQANLLWVSARITADEARFADPPDPHAPALALAAGHAERAAAVSEAEHQLLAAQQQLATAEAVAQTDDEQSKKAVETARQKVAESEKALNAAHEVAAKADAEYTPFEKEYPGTSTGRRLALARWIVDRDNPLTARVAVNHIWLRHFGAPLVESVFDFGNAGQPPSHPELLDWLAVELIDSGWSMKHLHRLIVTSEAYCRSTNVDAGPGSIAAAERDPDNVTLWRANVRRMEAEIVRDCVLYLGGQLDLALGGPDLDHQNAEIPRRSLYFGHAYEKQMTFLALFDAANPNECYRRTTSIAPQQALALANSNLARSQSRRLADRLAAELCGADGEIDEMTLITVAFEEVLGRPPSDEELGRCLAFLNRQTGALAESAQTANNADADDPPQHAADDPRQQARRSLIHVLINHHDFVTIR